jgi:ketosteroid isomerase-like protein
MTPDLPEATRRIVEALNRRDFDAPSVDYSQDAVFDGSAFGGEVFEGREAIRSFFEDWVGAFEDYEGKLEEVRDLGNGVIFFLVLHRGRPAGGSGFVELRHAYTATWADEHFQRTIARADIDQARAAAERLAEERG